MKNSVIGDEPINLAQEEKQDRNQPEPDNKMFNESDMPSDMRINATVVASSFNDDVTGDKTDPQGKVAPLFVILLKAKRNKGSRWS